MGYQSSGIKVFYDKMILHKHDMPLNDNIVYEMTESEKTGTPLRFQARS